MKKRLLSILLALCMVLALLPGTAWAAELREFERQAALTSAGLEPMNENVSDEPGIMPYAATVDFELENGAVLKFEPSTGAITNCIPNGATEINIPERIDGVSVTSIRDTAFSGCSGLTSVTIPNSVVSIGSNAFYKCSGLMSVTIPSGVISIGSSAFSGCSGLMSVTIPNSVRFIGHSAFFGCSGLTSVTIPNSVGIIEYEAFYGCSGLTSVTIPNSVTSIGNSAFYGCGGLTSVTIPNSVTSIGDWAFCGCSGLTSVTIPNSVTSIGDSAFCWCGGLTSVTIPNSVTSIGNAAFSGCSGLTSVTIPNNVTSIGDSVFSSCSGLTSVVIPDSITSIGGYAFFGCSGLTSVTIPSSVTSIGDFAFGGCIGLTSVAIPNSVTSIGDAVFSGCIGLTSVTIPNSVTSIGVMVFYSCSGLTSVVIPDSVTSIGNETFRGCRNLTNVAIPNSVTSIGDLAFDGCTGLTSVTIPNSVTSIGKGAFYFCSGLTSVVIPKSVTSIGEGAFDVCSILTIYCYKDSTAHHYAVEQDIPFVLLDEIPLHTVIFDSQGGSAVSAQTIPDGMCAVKPANPSKEGYIFNGWYTDPACTMPYQFDEPVTQDITLYAGWDDSDADKVVEASLYEEKENEQTRISGLKYSAGSFSYTKSTGIDIENWETTDYDKVYMSLTLKLPEEWTELLISRVNIEISLPDGLSFSSDAVETVRTFSFVLSTANELFWIPDPIYLLYSEHYTEKQELEINYTLTTEDSGHSLNSSTHLVSLDVLSTAQSIKILRENGSIDIYSSWNPTMFMKNSAQYNGDLALLSAYLSDLIEGANKANLKIRIQSVLSQLGFSKIQYSGAVPFDGYMEEYVCATKKVLIDGEVKTVLIFAIQGSDTTRDWLGNLTYTGLRDYHENFRTAYINNLTAFLEYCDEVDLNHYDPSVRLLITGHSRGGAIANLVAAEITKTYLAKESSVASNLYCYTFAAPNVETLSSDTSVILDGMDEYYNIFNIINCEDIVPFVPGGSMEKHGHKLIFNSHYSVAMGKYYGNPADGTIIPLRLLSLSSVIDVASTVALATNATSNIISNLNGFEGVLLNHSMQTYLDAVKSGSYDASYSALMKHIREQESLVRGLAVIIDAGTGKFGGSAARKIQNTDKPIHARIIIAMVKEGIQESIWKKGIKVLIHCPVDIEIRNSYNTTVCTIIDDQIQFYDDSIDDLSVLIYGDEKEIWYPKDSDYAVRIIGYDNGTMDYTLISTDENGDAESIHYFYDVPVFKDEIVLTSRLCKDTDDCSFTSGSGTELQPDESLTGLQIETVSIEIKSNQENVFALGTNSYAKGDYVLAAGLCLDDSLVFCGWYDENNQLVSMDEWYCFVAETNTYLCARYGETAAVTGITLDKSEITLAVGDTATLAATIAPENATNKTVIWTSSDRTVATVSDDGIVTAVAAGTATITVTTTDGSKTATCTVTVTAPADGLGSDTKGDSPGGYYPSTSSPSSGSSTTSSVTVSNPSTANGIVSSTVATAKMGDTVKVTSNAKSGYISAAPTVNDKDGNAVAVTKNADGTYSFTMPEGGVTITGNYITPAQMFSDVSDDAWYSVDLAFAVEHGLIEGYEGKFSPSGITSRGMIVTILYRLEGEPAVPQSTFTDVEAGQWYTDAVAWAAANKIVEGYGNNTFGPNDDITREQMATILYRYAAYKGYDVSGLADLSGYTDTEAISSWALTAMRWANSEGLMTGRTTTTLVPKGTATRAETATILARFCRDIDGLV